MRILHIATLVTPDGAYGGPIRVAVNQAKALRSDGHDVIIYAGHRGFVAPLPREIDSVPVELFPARTIVPYVGFAGLFAPSMIRRLLVAADSFDIVHIHMARDFITLPAAEIVNFLKRPYVAQTHGMIDESSKRLAAILDIFSTRRILINAHRVLWLTPVEKASLNSVAKKPLENLENMVNGVPFAEASTAREASKDVLFLSRLHSRKRPMLFATVARDLASDGESWRFSLVGPDEGEAREVMEVISSSPAAKQVVWEGPLPPERTLERMRKAAFYVLPSIDEPFPMSVLEALSVGLPVIVTDTCGLGDEIQSSGCGIVIDSSEKALGESMKHLMDNPILRNEMSKCGRKLVRERFSMSAVSEKLASIYAAVK